MINFTDRYGPAPTGIHASTTIGHTLWHWQLLNENLTTVSPNHLLHHRYTAVPNASFPVYKAGRYRLRVRYRQDNGVWSAWLISDPIYIRPRRGKTIIANTSLADALSSANNDDEIIIPDTEVPAGDPAPCNAANLYIHGPGTIYWDRDATLFIPRASGWFIEDLVLKRKTASLIGSNIFGTRLPPNTCVMSLTAKNCNSFIELGSHVNGLLIHDCYCEDIRNHGIYITEGERLSIVDCSIPCRSTAFGDLSCVYFNDLIIPQYAGLYKVATDKIILQNDAVFMGCHCDAISVYETSNLELLDTIILKLIYAGRIDQSKILGCHINYFDAAQTIPENTTIRGSLFTDTAIFSAANHNNLLIEYNVFVNGLKNSTKTKRHHEATDIPNNYKLMPHTPIRFSLAGRHQGFHGDWWDHDAPAYPGINAQNETKICESPHDDIGRTLPSSPLTGSWGIGDVQAIG